MKRIVWTFGLISGAILAAMMAITMTFADQMGVVVVLISAGVLSKKKAPRTPVAERV